MRRLSTARVMQVSIILACTLLACSPCGWLSTLRPGLPERTIVVSEEAARRFAEKLTGSWQTAGEGQLRLQFSDEELTSYLQLRLSSNTDLPLDEPRLWFSAGKAYLTGRLGSDQLPLDAQAALVVTPRLLDGDIQVSIEEASVGPVPVPRALVQTLQDRVNTSLTRAQLDVNIVRLEILEGEAIIVATRDDSADPQ